ncbi:ribonuclease H-like domain-containing protein [Aspergillus cavernicola]|uniref:Ribonuclease H-like domain-containing protein n=1 Tax=Aspergillus cavernicola TaxID=176166 RepID=A0ABR4I9A6_9EURO
MSKRGSKTALCGEKPPKTQKKTKSRTVKTTATTPSGKAKRAASQKRRAELAEKGLFKSQGSEWTLIPDAQRNEFITLLAGLIHSAEDLTQARYRNDMWAAAKHDPKAAGKEKKLRVVALDCEMVTIAPKQAKEGGDDEQQQQQQYGFWTRNGNEREHLVQLCVVDVLTGTTIIDTAVKPPVGWEVTDWRTRYSGMSAGRFARYQSASRCVGGVLKAREMVLNLINKETILVGHSMNHDLNILEISHKRVVDTQIVTRKAVAAKAMDPVRRYSLKELCLELLGRTLQTGHGKSGHNCVEDVLAPREIVIWWLKEENQGVREAWIRKKVAEAAAAESAGESSSEPSHDLSGYL